MTVWLQVQWKASAVFLASTFGLNTINSTIGCSTCENFEFHRTELQTAAPCLEKNERMKTVWKMRNSVMYWMLLALAQYKCTSATSFTLAPMRTRVANGLQTRRILNCNFEGRRSNALSTCNAHARTHTDMMKIKQRQHSLVVTSNGC